MAQTVSGIVGAEGRARLAVVVGDRNRLQKHVQRARIVLLSAERLPVLAVARRAGVSRPSVWRWQQRFAEAGVDGLLRDKTRKPGKAPLSAETVAKVLALPCAEPPGEATHWTGRAVARTVGVSLRSATDLGSAPAAAAPHPHLQALQRPGLRREGRGHRRPVHGPAGARRRALDRRKKPDPGARPPQPGLPLKPGKW